MDGQNTDNEFMDVVPPVQQEQTNPVESPSSVDPASYNSSPLVVTQIQQSIHNQNLKKVLKGRMQITADLIEHANGKVERELLAKSIEITSRLKRNRAKHPLPEVTEEQIRQKRNQALKMLEDIHAEELQLLRQRRLSKPSSQPRQLQRSSVNEEQNKKVKELWRQNRLLERNLRRKDLELRQAHFQEKETKARRSKQQLEDRRRKKRQKISTRLQQLESRKKLREEFVRQTDKTLQEQLHRKYLADQMEENYRRRVEEERRLRQERTNLQRKSTTVQMTQIKEHEKKYTETFNKLKKDREKKMHEFKQRFVSESVSRYEDLQIAQIIKQEAEEAKKKIADERLQRALYRNRIDAYNKQVKEKIPLPKLREKTQQAKSANQTGTLSDNKSLSFEELNRLGNSYLQVAKERAKKRESCSPETALVVPTRTPPRDYLRELRISRPSVDKPDDMNRLKRILHSSSENPSYERITEAMSLADRMQTLAGRNTRKLADCINAKLEILKTIM